MEWWNAFSASDDSTNFYARQWFGNELGRIVEDQGAVSRSSSWKALLAPARAFDPAVSPNGHTEAFARPGPEIHRLAQSAAAGEPIVRSLDDQFPNRGYPAITDQFLLGERILVAPILPKGVTFRQVAFPPGTWRNQNGETVRGPSTQSIAAPLDRLPWWRLQS